MAVIKEPFRPLAQVALLRRSILSEKARLMHRELKALAGLLNGPERCRPGLRSLRSLSGLRRWAASLTIASRFSLASSPISKADACGRVPELNFLFLQYWPGSMPFNGGAFTNLRAVPSGSADDLRTSRIFGRYLRAGDAWQPGKTDVKDPTIQRQDAPGGWPR